MDIVISNEMQIRIELISGRLKNSVNQTEIIRWLQNFLPEEQESALKILELTEYISTNEVFECFFDCFQQIFSSLDHESTVIIHPIGEYTKSGTGMVYYAKKVLRNFENSYKIKFFQHYREFKQLRENCRTVKKPVVIFIDDIYGTGDSAIEYYNTYIRASLCQLNEMAVIYFVSIVTMFDAKKNIEKTIPNALVISAMKRNKVFSKEYLLFDNLKEMEALRQMCYDYGTRLFTGVPENKPLGYNNSQALVSFSYGAPNNTLPVIWSSLEKWYPIFPRFLDQKMAKSREFRKEIAYLLGVAKAFGLSDFITTEFKEDEEIIQYIKKQDFQLLAYLKLKHSKHDISSICQILGIFEFDYKKIIKEAQRKKYVDGNENLTSDGVESFQKINKVINKYGLRKLRQKSIPLKETEYLPITFRGQL